MNPIALPHLAGTIPGRGSARPGREGFFQQCQACTIYFLCWILNRCTVSSAAGRTNTTLEKLIVRSPGGSLDLQHPRGADALTAWWFMVPVYSQLDKADAEDFKTWIDKFMPRASMACAVRMILVQRITSDLHDSACSPSEMQSDSLSLRSSDQEEKKEEKRDALQNTASCMLPLENTANRKPRSRQKPLIDDEACAVARRVVAEINRLRGTRYADTGATFDEVARNLRAHLKAGILEADIMLAIANRMERWGSDEKMAEHVNPVTLTRRSNLPRYIAEAKSPKQPSMFPARRMTAEQRKLADIREDRGKTAEQVKAENDEWCRQHGVSY